jgi:hypothetical protein
MRLQFVFYMFCKVPVCQNICAKIFLKHFSFSQNFRGTDGCAQMKFFASFLLVN